MNKKLRKLIVVGCIIVIFALLIYLNRPFILIYLNSALMGILLMKKLDNMDSYSFKYLIALLVVLNLSIILNLNGNFTHRDLLFIAYLPFALSYISGYIYFLIKGTY